MPECFILGHFGIMSFFEIAAQRLLKFSVRFGRFLTERLDNAFNAQDITLSLTVLVVFPSNKKCSLISQPT